jgi:hypothetical protein
VIYQETFGALTKHADQIFVALDAVVGWLAIDERREVPFIQAGHEQIPLALDELVLRDLIGSRVAVLVRGAEGMCFDLQAVARASLARPVTNSVGSCKGPCDRWVLQRARDFHANAVALGVVIADGTFKDVTPASSVVAEEWRSASSFL